MNIKIIGTGCPDCTRLHDNTVAALEQLGMDAEIEKIGDLMEIVKLGVLSAPSLMVDGKLLVSGKVASQKEIVKLLKKESGR
ncbi:MAG: TM0996/MTH895 family glutaredoxin-like protein [Oscillospiraceae bacterium]|nr:TM0996/MTH895 family glutaredoxin-like protein [Oscillospiraceae bacterium]